MTVYHMDFASSDGHVVCRFFHTLAQSVAGWSFVTCMSLGRFPAVDIVRKALRLKALIVSPCLGGSMLAMSSAYVRRYSKVFGILRVWGGSPWSLADPSTEAMQQKQPSRWPWIHIRVNRRARNFAATSITSQLPPLLCRMEMGALKTAPCHIYQAIADTSCRTHMRGWIDLCPMPNF
jgi:hypothetical protein